MSVGYSPQHFVRPDQNDTVRKLARFGYSMKGVIYVLVGVLALLAAFGEGGQVSGGEGAVQTIAAQPFGEVLLVIVGLGLCAYALWRFAEGALDLRGVGSDSKGIAKRLGFAGSGLMNGAVGVFALDIVFGSGSSSGGGAATWVGKLMHGSTLGAVIVGAIGLGFIVFGLAEIVKGYKEKFVRRLRTEQMNASERRWVVLAGKVGYIARGAVLPIIGVFLLQAVFQRDPSEARGLGGALREIASQPFGMILLAIVAFGLVCYGAYQIVFAKYGKLTAR